MKRSTQRFNAEEILTLKRALSIVKKYGRRKYEYDVSRLKAGIRALRKDYDLGK